jgi:glycosyltransferase involved in cell wall biosynthesis
LDKNILFEKLQIMKKVLILTYYFPPSGGAGVQRWLKFAKYLPEFGWQPTIITTKDGDYPIIDNSLLDEIPQNIKIIRTKTPSIYNIYAKFMKNGEKVPYGSMQILKNDSIFKKLSLYIRKNFIIPDARKVWNKHAFLAAKKELLIRKYDAVITTGPPHSTHLIGLKLKTKFGVKWITDFRDPWTKIDYLQDVKRWWCTTYFDKKMEQIVIAKCDKLISINNAIITDFGVTKKSIRITNGFDSTDFEITKKPSKKFTINYFGNIIKTRNPMPIYKALKKINLNVELNFYGNIDENLMAENCKNHPYLPHTEMLDKMINSNLLLLIINKTSGNEGIITGKIFEYLAANVPIVGIGPNDGEAAKILTETGGGKMFDYHQIDEISKYIELQYEHWENNKIHNTKCEKYSRRNLTKLLANFLDK